VKERYKNLQNTAKNTDCKEQYEEFCTIEKDVTSLLEELFDNTIRVLVNSSEKKIKLYEEAEKHFHIKAFKEQSCILPAKRNREYIANMEGNK